MRRRPKSAARKSRIKTRVKIEDKPKRLTKREVSHFLEQILSEERNERVWAEMTSAEPDASDAFTDIEEHLICRPREPGGDMRRWKFFGK